MSDIVIDEMKQHILDCFYRQSSSLKETVNNYKKLFGDLLDIDYEVKCKNDKDYEDFINQSLVDTLNSHMFIKRFTYPDCFKSLINSAIKTIKPFRSGNGYTDAGFKDAILFETIKNFEAIENSNVVLYTQDHDFDGAVEHSNLTICYTFDEVKNLLIEVYDIRTIEYVEKIVNDMHHKEELLNSIGIEYDDSVENYIIGNIVNLGEQKYKIDVICVVNETDYYIEYQFDAVSNEILNAIQRTEND